MHMTLTCINCIVCPILVVRILALLSVCFVHPVPHHSVGSAFDDVSAEVPMKSKFMVRLTPIDLPSFYLMSRYFPLLIPVKFFRGHASFLMSNILFLF